jgi:hypothetical protein
MNHPGRFLVACLIVSFVVAGASLAAETPEDAAQAAAESWLNLVDGGQYSASWDHAARALKSAVKQASWVETAEGARRPLGGLVSRTLKSRDYT